MKTEETFHNENYWFSFLTKDELNDLNKRTPPTNVVHSSFTECLFYRFKYLYKPLTKQEFNKWKKVAQRVEKTISNEKMEKHIYIIHCSPVDTMCASFELKYAFDNLEKLDKFLTTPNNIVKGSTFKKTSAPNPNSLLHYIEVPEDKTNWNVLRVRIIKFELCQ